MYEQEIILILYRLNTQIWIFKFSETYRSTATENTSLVFIVNRLVFQTL